MDHFECGLKQFSACRPPRESPRCAKIRQIQDHRSCRSCQNPQTPGKNKAPLCSQKVRDQEITFFSATRFKFKVNEKLAILV
ncbi:hypothetical protein L596_001219 [Steinernema carpocapsae]|uniref:Uncharacterized protein n=1 Tax=Steinernema carpocapsae TaxID=34508 RepID=A0A4U8UMP2_STECR|nr:hypothetical protein L596_001219 [Steinernema carpocapsae]